MAKLPRGVAGVHPPRSRRSRRAPAGQRASLASCGAGHATVGDGRVGAARAGGTVCVEITRDEHAVAALAPDRRYVALLRAVNVGGRSVRRTRCATRSPAGGPTRAPSSRRQRRVRAAPAVDAIVAGACRRLRGARREPVVMVRSAAEIARLLRRGRSPAARRGRQALHRVPAGLRRRPRLPLLLPKEELDLVHVSQRRVLGGEPAQAERLVRISRRLRRTRRGRRRAPRATGPR